MKIYVPTTRQWPNGVGEDAIILNPDNWNDYGYTTTYTLWVRVNNSITEVGDVKIGRENLEEHEQPLDAGIYPNGLPPGSFSLGQSVEYYEKVQSISLEVAEPILELLRDIALNSNGERVLALQEKATTTSLLRSVSIQTVEHQFSRIATGGSSVEKYAFQYTQPFTLGNGAELNFEIDPNSNPPTNIHVLVGRNGVGKTKLLNRLARSSHEFSPLHGRVADSKTDLYPFANVVSVSFSAFDAFDLSTRGDKVNHDFIGLRSPEHSSTLKTSDELQGDLTASLREIFANGAGPRLLSAIETIDNDPNFADFGLSTLTGPSEGDLHKEQRKSQIDLSQIGVLFSQMSSGHKIVLLTITKLVELVTERSLVLIDEPEAHLHPPLLSSFMRVLSRLLIDRNGVAIVATHSPVVLQEVPRSCVWILERVNGVLDPRRPDQETFGESIGTLTRDVFGLEVSGSGFHREISEAVQELTSYAAVIERFGGRLGTEARGLVQVLFAEKAIRRPQ